MLISQALELAKTDLRNSAVQNPSLDAMILMRHATSLSTEDIVFYGTKKEISDDDLVKLKDFVARRCKKEPISHITNHREFFGLDFFVDKRVLDPRPDSEVLVEILIERIGNKQLKTLEIGVGSGCLTISLLKNAKNCQAIGVDISAEALEVCQRNIMIHDLGGRFKTRLGDLFCKIRAGEKFDVIISNPPYIKSKEIDALQEEVRFFEPRGALDGGDDGLEFYRRIALDARKFLRENGLVALEIGHDQRSDVISIFSENNFILDTEKQDLAGNDRVLVFR